MNLRAIIWTAAAAIFIFGTGLICNVTHQPRSVIRPNCASHRGCDQWQKGNLQVIKLISMHQLAFKSSVSYDINFGIARFRLTHTDKNAWENGVQVNSGGLVTCSLVSPESQKPHQCSVAALLSVIFCKTFLK